MFWCTGTEWKYPHILKLFLITFLVILVLLIYLLRHIKLEIKIYYLLCLFFKYVFPWNVSNTYWFNEVWFLKLVFHLASFIYRLISLCLYFSLTSDIFLCLLWDNEIINKIFFCIVWYAITKSTHGLCRGFSS